MAMNLFQDIEAGRVSPTVDEMAEDVDLPATPSTSRPSSAETPATVDEMEEDVDLPATPSTSRPSSAETSATVDEMEEDVDLPATPSTSRPTCTTVETPATATASTQNRSKRGLFAKTRSSDANIALLDRKKMACRRSRKKLHLMKTVQAIQDDEEGCNQDVFLFVVNRDDGLGYFTGTPKFKANFKMGLPICQYTPALKDTRERKKRTTAVDTNNFNIDPDNSIPPVPESPQRPTRPIPQPQLTPQPQRPEHLRQQQLLQLDALQLHQGNSLNADPQGRSGYVSRTRNNPRPT